MTDITLEQRARELLAAECGAPSAVGLHVAVGTQQALRAIESALRLSAGEDWIPAAKYPDDGNGDDDSYNAGWNACRSAMLAAAPRHETGEVSRARMIPVGNATAPIRQLGIDMDNVLRFAPNTQALENIPHMLRYWADMIERDQAAGAEIDLVALVMVQSGSPRPAFFTCGDRVDTPMHPLWVAGMFDACRQMMLAAATEETP